MLVRRPDATIGLPAGVHGRGRIPSSYAATPHQLRGERMPADRDADSAAAQDCLFCTIIAGDIDADLVHQSERSLAFRDVNPQAPTHVLVVPRRHHRDVGALAGADPQALADLVAVATTVAEREGLDGWRVVFNTGAEAGQSVFHCHAHVLGGRTLGWPPG